MSEKTKLTITNEEEFLEKVEKAAERGGKAGAKKGGRGKGILSTLITIILIIAGVTFATNYFNPKNIIDRDEPVENHDLTLENHGILGYTVADFAEAMLGDSSQLKKLEVYETEVSDVATLTETGFANLKFLSKCQLITFYGTATYTVDLSKLKADDIELDEHNKKITLYIPHVVQEKINIPADKIKYGEVKKGKLAFGSIKVKPEDVSKVQSEAENKMIEKLDKEKEIDKADRFAKMSVWEIYQPLVVSVSPEYKLEVEFR